MLRSLIVLVLLPPGCVLIPLPASGPPIEVLTLPVPGEQVAGLRERLGDPQLIDSASMLAWQWSSDRDFLIVPAFPIGVPVGGVIERGVVRLIVAVDDGLVHGLRCLVKKDGDGLPTPDASVSSVRRSRPMVA